MEERQERIQEIEEQIAQLKEERMKLKQMESKSFVGMKQYFAEKVDAEFSSGKTSMRLLHGHRKDAWDSMRKLAMCSVIGDDMFKHFMDYSDEEYTKARIFLKKLIDFYVENAENP